MIETSETFTPAALRLCKASPACACAGFADPRVGKHFVQCGQCPHTENIHEKAPKVR